MGRGSSGRVSDRPLLLLTNDDGIRAAGLRALERALARLGEVWTVAPAAEQPRRQGQ
jgi:5'-nucleotidase